MLPTVYADIVNKQQRWSATAYNSCANPAEHTAALMQWTFAEHLIRHRLLNGALHARANIRVQVETVRKTAGRAEHDKTQQTIGVW